MLAQQDKLSKLAGRLRLETYEYVVEQIPQYNHCMPLSGFIRDKLDDLHQCRRDLDTIGGQIYRDLER